MPAEQHSFARLPGSEDVYSPLTILFVVGVSSPLSQVCLTHTLVAAMRILTAVARIAHGAATPNWAKEGTLLVHWSEGCQSVVERKEHINSGVSRSLSSGSGPLSTAQKETT